MFKNGNRMNIYPCGSSVVITRSGYQGDVTAVEIRYELVRYEVTYYVEGVQQRIWVHEKELNNPINKVKLGFKNHKRDE